MWSGLGLQTGYHYLIDMYNVDEQRILALFMKPLNKKMSQNLKRFSDLSEGPEF